MFWKNNILLVSTALIILLFSLPILSGAADKNTWRIYAEDCRRLNNQMDVVKKQISDKEDVVFTQGLKFRLEHIERFSKKVVADPNDPNVFSKCEDSIKKAKTLLKIANEYEAQLNKTQEIEAKKRHEGAPEMKIAKFLGYKDFEYLDSIKGAFKKGGLKNLKQTLFFISNNSMNYSITQQIDTYLIYTISSSYSNFVSTPKIVVQPLKGEFIRKGNYIPGSYYKVLDLVKVTGLDGFPATLPLLQRVMTKEERLGYGAPPSDTECRNLIIGSWSRSRTSDIYTYKPDGVLESITYSQFQKEGQKSSGTWKIENHFITAQIKSLDGLSSGSWSGKIIKLMGDKLIVNEVTEVEYTRIK